MSQTSAPTTNDPAALADELRTTFLFENLNDEQLAWLVDKGEVCTFDGGTKVYAEHQSGDFFYVLLDGGIRLTRQIGSDVVANPETTQRGVYAGAIQGLLTDVGADYRHGMETTRPSRFFRLRTSDYAQFLRDWFPMAVHLLDGLLVGLRTTESMVRQHEQLVALGALSAGLAHELNNPAAAAMRSSEQLRTRIAGMRHKLGTLASGKVPVVDLTALVNAQERVVELAAKAPRRSAIEESEAEDRLMDWLDDHEIVGSWDIAPVFAATGVEAEWLEAFSEQIDPTLLDPAIRWLTYTLETESLMTEIEDATSRISNLVSAVKQYSHMDRMPFQDLDITAGLNSTLTMLNHALEGIEVVRDYPDTVPLVPGYGGELNQVWTNLIDNARQALDGAGTLTVRVYGVDDGVEIQVCDDGPGIPPDVQPRIFEAFYTTKPAGQGTGLGLEIAQRIIVQRHHGRIDVTSEPGKTCFTVWLPFRQTEA